ncbi:MAG TPA: hypothetical protein VHD36_14280 [Pirellulales bacterium]|nr:hypothetical protein [Pirellulales bacterium]
MGAYDDGLACGKWWATHATGIDTECRRLQSLRAGKSDAQWQDWFRTHEEDRPAFQRLVKVIRPDASITPREVSGFWQAAIRFGTALAPSALRDGAFVRGFAEGALRAWEESGAAGERGSESPDEDWLDKNGGPTTDNDT